MWCMKNVRRSETNLTMDVIWNGDTRYPGPKTYGLPDYIKGVPSQEEIEALPEMFTWGEIKETISEWREQRV